MCPIAKTGGVSCDANIQNAKKHTDKGYRKDHLHFPAIRHTIGKHAIKYTIIQSVVQSLHNFIPYNNEKNTALAAGIPFTVSALTKLPGAVTLIIKEENSARKIIPKGTYALFFFIIIMKKARNDSSQQKSAVV